MSLDKVLVTQMLVGPDEVFSYLVSCPASRAAVLIDPGGDPEKILDAVSRKRLDVRYILCTHGHADHLYAAAALREELGAMVCMHEADAAFFGKGASGGDGSPFPHIDVRLKEGLILTFGGRDALVIHTPGHTPGSVCFLVGRHLFTGDTLFVGAAGRTDLAGGSLDELLDSIREKLLPLSGDTIVWPGHDYGETPASTLARERRENIYITDFLMEDE